MSDAREAMLRLLDERAIDATICPSEVARAIAPEGRWREAMPLVHSAVDAMVSDGMIGLSWKGQDLDMRSGPYRIALRPGRQTHR